MFIDVQINKYFSLQENHKMTDEQKARQFFIEVLKCFKIDSFKAVNSIDMLLVVNEEWYNYLMASKEFGFINNVENMDFFVCTTSKSGIAFKGDLNKEEIDRLNLFKHLYKYFHQLDMNSQGKILEDFFTNNTNLN